MVRGRLLYAPELYWSSVLVIVLVVGSICFPL
jgi:hypothetical protein